MTQIQKLRSIQEAKKDGPQDFYLPPIGDRHLNIRLSRNTTIALLVSLVLHAIVLFFVVPDLIKTTKFPERKTISVTLLGPESAAPAARLPEPPPAPKPLPSPKSEVKPKKITQAEPIKAPKVLAVPSPQAPQQTIAPTTPSKAPDRQPPAEQPTDMMALVNANRQRREGDNKGVVPNGLPLEDSRDAVIKKNLAQEGTNGIFQIKEINLRSAQFTFRGWKSNYGNARLELVDVQAGPNESIERAIVRKMIVIIRRDYSGDFHWLSPRYGDVVKSARVEDTAELEQFLLEEFFPNRTFK